MTASARRDRQASGCLPPSPLCADNEHYVKLATPGRSPHLSLPRLLPFASPASRPGPPAVVPSQAGPAEPARTGSARQDPAIPAWLTTANDGWRDAVPVSLAATVSRPAGRRRHRVNAQQPRFLVRSWPVVSVPVVSVPVVSGQGDARPVRWRPGPARDECRTGETPGQESLQVRCARPARPCR